MEVGAVSTPDMRGNRYFFSKREGSQNQPVIYWREGYKGDRPVLIDPAELDAIGLDDGRVDRRRRTTASSWPTAPIARATRTRRCTCSNVDTGEMLPLEIPDKTQAAQWLPDGSGFVYQNLKNPKDPYSGQVLFHRMGTIASTRTRSCSASSRKRRTRSSRRRGDRSAACRATATGCVLGYWIDTKSNDLWLANFDDVPQDRQGRRRRS